MDNRMNEFFNHDKILTLWGPRIVEIVLTNICNSRCLMCDRYRWVKDNRERLREMTLEKLLSLFSEFREMNVKRVPLSGGEPLMRKDFPDIVRGISANGMDVTVVNNGTYMTPVNARVLAEAGATMIFSLEGSTPELHDKSRGVRGTWQRATTGIKNGVAARRETGRGETIINFVIQNFNSSDMYDAAVLAEQLGVDSIRFAMVHGYTTTDVHVNSPDLLHDSVRKIRSRAFDVDIVLSPYLQWLLEGRLESAYARDGLPAYGFFEADPAICMVAYQSTLIDTWGDVYPCTYSYFDNQPGDERFDMMRKENVLGNVFDNSFKEVWTGDAYQRFRKNHLPVAVARSPEVCGQCEHYYAFKSIEKTVKKALDESPTIDQAMQRVGEEKPCGCFSNEFEFRVTPQRSNELNFYV